MYCTNKYSHIISKHLDSQLEVVERFFKVQAMGDGGSRSKSRLIAVITNREYK